MIEFVTMFFQKLMGIGSALGITGTAWQIVFSFAFLVVSVLLGLKIIKWLVVMIKILLSRIN